jgi:hypothetical protein
MHINMLMAMCMHFGVFWFKHGFGLQVISMQVAKLLAPALLPHACYMIAREHHTAAFYVRTLAAQGL